MRKRGGDDRVKGGSELQGIEEGRIGKKGRLWAVCAALSKSVAGEAAALRIFAVAPERGNAGEARAGGTRAQALAS